jgi:hypothetical protein
MLLAHQVADSADVVFLRGVQGKAVGARETASHAAMNDH